MKAAGCDFVVLGTIIRETIGTIGEARKTGFNPTFLGSSAAYTDLIHKLGGKAMDGLYATMTCRTRTWTRPRSRSASGPTSTRPSSTKTRPCSRPTATSIIDHPGAQKAGPNLNTDSFIKAMDTMTVPPTSSARRNRPSRPPSAWAATLRACQLRKWKVVSTTSDSRPG
jgi:branched-chain amino acid transport system substrate-binding protein